MGDQQANDPNAMPGFGPLSAHIGAKVRVMDAKHALRAIGLEPHMLRTADTDERGPWTQGLTGG